MHRWYRLGDLPADLGPTVATFGNFDGVHRGHQAILARVATEATQRGATSVAVTFDPHPVTVFHPERRTQVIAPGVLREELLATTGIDGLLTLEFTPAFASQSATDFIESTFVRALGVTALVVGQDTRGFGKDYTGDVALLHELAGRHGFDLIVLDDLGQDLGRWSSSAVRGLLGDGDVSGAARVLGRPHRVAGQVVHGDHRGRELGYPTANLAADALGLVPADGVYAGWLTRLELDVEAPDRTLPAAISVGTNPTFDGTQRRVEAYVLDRTDLDLYDEQVRIEFVDRIRPTLRFDSVEDLLAAMARDVAHCHRVLSSMVPS